MNTQILHSPINVSNVGTVQANDDNYESVEEAITLEFHWQGDGLIDGLGKLFDEYIIKLWGNSTKKVSECILRM